MTDSKFANKARRQPLALLRWSAGLALAACLAPGHAQSVDDDPVFGKVVDVGPVRPVVRKAAMTRKGGRARPPRGHIAPASYAPIKGDGEVPVTVPEIEMFVGESRVLSTPGVARIAVGNGKFLTATALDDKETLLFANTPGTSSLSVWNREGQHQRIKVHVLPDDMSRSSREVAAFLKRIPKARASVVGDKVIVEGDELSDSDRDKVAEMAKRYPQIVNFTSTIGWEKMVMMDVKVVEFPRTQLQELGLKWNAVGGAAIGAIWSPAGRSDPGGRTITIRTGEANPPPISGPDGGRGPLILPKSLTTLSAINLGLNAQLNALEQKGSATILAEPQLSARSGYKANFLAGGEIPYSVSTVNGVTIVFKPYGIKLEIEPRVGQNGVIRAVIESEVSSLDASLTTSLGPALLTRRTKTEFNVREGETIVLSGLIQRNASADVDKVPLLGDIPILGALFRSKRYQNKETELVVFVTPTVVTPQSPAMVDRVQRATGRLERELGRVPHLTEPLQPGMEGGRPNALPVPVVQPPAAPAIAPIAPIAPDAEH